MFGYHYHKNTYTLRSKVFSAIDIFLVTRWSHAAKFSNRFIRVITHDQWESVLEAICSTNDLTIIMLIVIASVDLINSGDGRCPGTYTCSIEANSENVYLEWEISPLGKPPIRIMYGSGNTSEKNVPRMLDSIGSVVFTEYTAPQHLGLSVADGYIESTLTISLLSMNGTTVKCGTNINNAVKMTLFNTSGKISFTL